MQVPGRTGMMRALACWQCISVMETILEKLHNDHINFSKLLTFLEEQLRLLEDCELSNLGATLDAIRYMKEYPDYIHHPLEDIVFKYFLEHYGQERENINELLHEHDAMPVLTEKLLEALQNALTGVAQEREELCTVLREYISVQRKHMSQEEVQVYPALNANLNEKDWQAMDNYLAQAEDPLFGGKVQESYQRLFQQIMNQ